MKISDHLKKQQNKQLDTMRKANKDEKINWSEMMNMNMQTLRRGKGGAMRRK